MVDGLSGAKSPCTSRGPFQYRDHLPRTVLLFFFKELTIDILYFTEILYLQSDKNNLTSNPVGSKLHKMSWWDMAPLDIYSIPVINWGHLDQNIMARRCLMKNSPANALWLISWVRPYHLPHLFQYRDHLSGKSAVTFLEKKPHKRHFICPSRVRYGCSVSGQRWNKIKLSNCHTVFNIIYSTMISWEFRCIGISSVTVGWPLKQLIGIPLLVKGHLDTETDFSCHGVNSGMYVIVLLFAPLSHDRL